MMKNYPVFLGLICSSVMLPVSVTLLPSGFYIMKHVFSVVMNLSSYETVLYQLAQMPNHLPEIEDSLWLSLTIRFTGTNSVS